MTEDASGMMIVQGVFRVRPEERADYLAHAEETMRTSREEHGCLEYVLAADPIDPGRIVLSERWQSKADLDAHARGLAARRREAAARGDASGPEAISREITVFEVASATTLG